MELSQLLRLASSPGYVKNVLSVIVKFHDEIRDMERKPRFFTVCITDDDELLVVNRFLQCDSENRTRVFVCKQLPEYHFVCGRICAPRVEKNIYLFLLYNSVMLAIKESDESLPLLMNSEQCNIAKLVKSRLTQRELWSELRPLCLNHHQSPICQLRYGGKPVEMYLSPISLMNYILGLDAYRKPHGYLAPNDGLIPHIGKGFYTGFYL